MHQIIPKVPQILMRLCAAKLLYTSLKAQATTPGATGQREKRSH